MPTRKQLDTQQVVVWYTRHMLTLRQIAELTGVTAPTIAARLRAAGVSAHDGTWIKRACAFCGIEVLVRRARARKTSESFCCQEHYAASRENPDYRPWRTGQRLARAVVSQYFLLLPGHIVHHKDGDNHNNDRANLAVYASHSDHLTHHHGKRHVDPIWDGAKSPR